MKRFSIWCCAAASLASAGASQTLLELVPTKRTGSQVMVLTMGKSVPPISHLFVRGNGSQSNYDAAPLMLEVSEAGVTVIGADFHPRKRAMGGELMQALGITQIAADDIEEHASAATIVRIAGEGDSPGAQATARTGLRFEIRPMIGPTQVPPGSDLPVKVYLQGEALPNAVIKLAPQKQAERARGAASKGNPSPFLADPPDWISKMTDADGFCTFTMPAKGSWRIQAVVLQGTKLFSSTLTFENGGGLR